MWISKILLGSEFEGKLLSKLCTELKKAELSLDSKLVITLITYSFENFGSALEEVTKSEINFVLFLVIF